MIVQQEKHILLIAMTDSICKNDFVKSLRQKNYRFLFAETGEEVIGIFRERPEINLLLIDIDLPVINGIETVTKIRQLDANVPIILMVTYITLESLRLAQNIGCNEILQTPVDQKTLEAIILKYLPVCST
ncbi:MAG: response regulator [Bacteroidetes bacterium]|nr:response regulator [Bacteroidota bacterium]